MIDEDKNYNVSMAHFEGMNDVNKDKWDAFKMRHGIVDDVEWH